MRLTVSELEKHHHGLILLKLPSQVNRRAPGGCPLRRAGVDHQRQAGVRPEDDQTQDHQEAARVPHRNTRTAIIIVMMSARVRLIRTQFTSQTHSDDEF